MKRNAIVSRAFTLVELLVVITILAIISATAYTKFSGATDKAKNSTKLGHLTTLETALNLFNQTNSYYPMPSTYSATNNVWGYDSAVGAQLNNTMDITLSADGTKITAFTSGTGGGRVHKSGDAATQVGAKGVVDSTNLSKEYLSQELFDPSIADAVYNDTSRLKEKGIGKYVYAVYATPATLASWNAGNKKAQKFNLAATFYDDTKALYVSKITGNYDETSCIGCPKTLIGSGVTSSGVLNGSGVAATSYADPTASIPYPIAY